MSTSVSVSSVVFICGGVFSILFFSVCYCTPPF